MSKYQHVEQYVLDEIDELIATQVDEHGVPLDDYTRDRYVKCERCDQDWHGLPLGACPGAYGMSSYIGPVQTEYEGTLCTVHLYADGHGRYVGLLMPGPQERELSCDLYQFDEMRSSFEVHVVADGVALPVLLHDD